VNGSTAMLHDGRARNVTEAILWHGGEAEPARGIFRNMSRPDRDALLKFLESQASAAGAKVFKLETGNKQPEAIDLYSRSGYVRCGPFGDYVEDANSVFMSKDAC